MPGPESGGPRSVRCGLGLAKSVRPRPYLIFGRLDRDPLSGT